MATEVLSVISEDTYWESVRKAAAILREGGLVAFPTETVYGLAASAEKAEAVRRLRQVKGRSAEGPLTVHIARRSAAQDFLNEFPRARRRLIDRSWPGPLTLVFEVAHPELAPITAGKDEGFVGRVYYDGTVGLRCPDCPAASDTIREAGCVVIATSANRTGRKPPFTAKQVLSELDGEIDLLLDGGTTQYAAPSTIARIREHRAEIIRQGVLDERTVRKLASTHILLVCTGNTCRSPMAEGLLRTMLAEKLGCEVSQLEEYGNTIVSAGTCAIHGASPTPEAIEAMAELGIDITEQRSSSLTAEMIREAQVILVMTESHRASVQNLQPDAKDHCFLVGGETNIEDPLGCTTEVYKNCREQIKAGLEMNLTENIL